MLRRAPVRLFSRDTLHGHTKQWLQRQSKDRWVARAHEQEYRSRSAYKLKQLDTKFSFLKKNGVISNDLGCFAGGWSQVALQRTGVGQGRGTGAVIGVDKVRMEPLGQHQFVLGDVTEPATLKQVQSPCAREARRRGAVRHGPQDVRAQDG
ncbi:unnamed protein product [Prorocentrum cordatum]|uniref:rRNA methyltransferase 2, mitochondrial n=1 Tax=Prorocentrum cordatum TaxID=2364126 RepID=A0ABN9VXD5_9DINO|nr:unnamed protein product [Polarella glacialis]